MRKNDKLGVLIWSNPLPFLTILFIVNFMLLSYYFFPLISPPIINLFFALLLTELILRLLLFLNYGSKYIYRFRPFLIEKDKLCGYKLKNNSDSKSINFPIFDKCIFQEGIQIPLDKKKNIEKRANFNTNQYGLRTSIKVENNNKKKDLKIFCIGGSNTVGWGINNNQTWPNRLEEKLNKKGCNCEVFNAGVYGYDSFQDLQNLKYNLLKLKPDILILHQGWNEEFDFTALDAGKRFKPKHARGYFEKYYFFTNNLPLFPYKFLTILFSYRFIRRKIALKGYMNFQNRKRWTVLLNDKYIKNWYDNLFEIKKICDSNNIKLFLTDYPCLVNNYDSITEREIYINNSRLTTNFAAYQAFSKSRIEEFFIKISEYFDILDGTLLFNEIKGKKRLKFFTDEIHLSVKGEDLLSESIMISLLKKLDKSNLNNGKKLLNKINFIKEREFIGINSPELNIAIRRFISKKFI